MSEPHVSLLRATAILLLGSLSGLAPAPRSAAEGIETETTVTTRAAKLAGGAWIPQGPAPALFGQPENIPQSPITGAIESVVAHPTAPNTLWVGTVNGGVFRTDNATAASPLWRPQTDAQGSLSVASLELDPTDGTNNTILAGVGRTSSLAGLGGPRTGLLRSTDGGASWTALNSMLGRDIVGVAGRGSIIVVAVERSDFGTTCLELGIWRSVDTGASFTQMSNNPGGTGLPCGFAWDLAGDPTDSTRLFAPATGLGGATDGIYRSTNTGATWTKVSNAAMDALLSAFPSNVHIAVGNAGGASANVYVAVVNGGGQLAGLFRSGNAGTTWATLDLPMTTEQGTSYGIHPGTQGNIHLSLVADPTDPNVVYVGGDRQPANNENGLPGVQFPNSIGADQYGGRLFRVDASQAPGSQATPITNCSTPSAACGGAIRTANDTAPHADSRDMAFDANGDLLQTDDGGIYRHTDPNGSTGDWESVNGTLPVTEQHDSAYDSISNIMISGNQDNGTTQQVLAGNDTWNAVFGGDGGDVTVGENDPAGGACTGTPPCSTRYLSAQFLGGARRRVFDSNNVQQSFNTLGLAPLGGAPAPTPQFSTPIEVNAITPSRVLLGAGNGTYESFTRLDTVSQVIAGFPVNIFTGGGPMAYGTAGDVGAFYYVTGDDVVGVTAAFGAFLSDPGTSADLTAGVVMDPANAATAFAIDTDQVFQTTDGASTAPWTDITGNLQTFSPGTLRSIEYVESASGDGLVVGATAGVFRALAPAFNVWDRLGTLPNVGIWDLDWDPADDVLAAGTLGRGSWLLPDASLQIHNLCDQTFALVTNQWKQIALACDPGGGATVASVFGDDFTGTYGTNWIVYRYDASAQSYVQLATTDTVSVGQGYWIKTNMPVVAPGVDTAGTVNAVTDVALVTSTADPPAGCASSAGRCNMVGTPHAYDVCWADVQVVDGANVLSLAEADPGGVCQAANADANGCVMSRIAHKWTGASYAPFDGQTPGMEGTTVPWDGFWVSAVRSGIQLRLPSLAGGSGLPCGNPRGPTPAGWHIRLIAESGELVDRTNVLGQLSDSLAGYDAHDLEELAPFGDPFLTVVFPHDDWGEQAGDYASDYRAYSLTPVVDEWRFEVRSSEADATVTLRWEGPNERLSESTLIDEETGESMAVNRDGSYSFTLTGTSRSFRWVVRTSGPIFQDGFESGDASGWQLVEPGT